MVGRWVVGWLSGGPERAGLEWEPRVGRRRRGGEEKRRGEGGW